MMIELHALRNFDIRPTLVNELSKGAHELKQHPRGDKKEKCNNCQEANKNFNLKLHLASNKNQTDIEYAKTNLISNIWYKIR